MGISFDFLFPNPDPDQERTGTKLFFYRLWCHFGQLTSANLLCLLFSVPVITIPAAYAALCRITGMLVRNEPVSVWEDFFGAFRSNFKSSILVGFATMSAPVLAFYVIPFYRTYAQQNPVFLLPLGIVVLATVFQIMMSFYAYPMLSSLDMTAGTVIRNSALLTLVKLPQNLLTLLILSVIWVAVVLLLPLSLIVVVFLLFSIVSLVTVTRVWPVIDTYAVRKQ